MIDDLRLLNIFRPNHYDLQISLERQERRFSGKVTIGGTMPDAGKHIALHAHELHILSATIDGMPASFKEDEQDVLTIATRDLTAGEHCIAVEFEGTITDPMHGLYPCYFKLNGQDEELLATQFESHHAREVFPCIDEPEAKAAFDLTLRTETDIQVVSNMPTKHQHEENGRLVTSFEATPVMSTYLLAWVVGKLAHIEAVTKDGVTLRAYATPDKLEQLRFSLDIAVKILAFYNEYFAINYPLPKCDLIALPDFSSGAMENWGCITFREATLLVDSTTSTANRQYVAMVVAHELAHQWFGNLVTMKWWNDLWLNESFANWIEYLAVDHLFPEWGMWMQYYDTETTRAIARDGLTTVQTIQQNISSPAEIHTIFDPAIVYAKGGSLLNMLHKYLGAITFRDGLRLYLKRHAYQNTEADDLWSALAEASEQDIKQFMHPWTTQPGIPVVTVGKANRTIDISQRRFYINPQQHSQNDQSIWPIPLLATPELSPPLLRERAATLSGSSDTQLLNTDHTGYYLTLYDSANLQRLATLVKSSTLAVADRLGLLFENLCLAQAGLQPLDASLRLLDAYEQENSYPVWCIVAYYFETLKIFTEDEPGLRTALRTLMSHFAQPQYNRLGWQPRSSELYFDELLRPLIITSLAYAEDPLVTQKLRQTFDAAEKPSDIWSDIRIAACRAAARTDGEAALSKMLGWYRHTTTSAQERVQLIAGIAELQEDSLIVRVLKILTTDDVKKQDLFYWMTYLCRATPTRQLTWQWMKNHWQWIEEHMSGDIHYADFPRQMAAGMCTPEELQSYRAFFEPKLADLSLKRPIEQGIEEIAARVAWLDRDHKAVAEYLRTYVT